MATQTRKFRPYLTYTELQEISASLKKSASPSRLNLVRYLDKYIAEIESGFRSPNHILQPTLEQKLELDSPSHSLNPPTHNPEHIHLKWTRDPSSITPAELEVLLEYRYRNNLMSQSEESEYEKANGISF